MKRRIGLAACIISLALLTGCSLDPLSGHLTTQPPDATYQPITPTADGAVSDKQTVSLYFEYQDEKKLSTESREIEPALDARVEQCVIEELIKGPSADHPELTTLIPANTRVMNVEEREGILFVTLSKEFLEIPSDAPASWETDEYWAKEIPARRLLALDSIVCAITDMGKYDKVQLLIDPDNDGEKPGERVLRYNFYPDAKKDANLMLDVIKRDESAVLTPRNTINAALGYMQGKNWEELYKYVAPQDGADARPAKDDFISDMQSRAYTLVKYTVGDAMVSNDGQRATVCVEAQLTFKDESTREVTSFPLRLSRDDEVWKLTMASITSLLEG